MKNEANIEEQLLEWPLEAITESESILVDLHIKMPNFTSNISSSPCSWQLFAMLGNSYLLRVTANSNELKLVHFAVLVMSVPFE